MTDQVYFEENAMVEECDRLFKYPSVYPSH
jgi:hypothetical protein